MQNKNIEIFFEDGQGLGNQLWLYAALRGISKFHDANYFVNSVDKFKGKDFLEIDLGTKKASKLENFFEQLYYDEQLNNLSCIYDSSIETISSNIILKGLFQSEKYFYGNEKLLSSWIRPSQSIKKESINFNKYIILNIRGGEYKRHNNLILPKSYWENALNILNSKNQSSKVLIVTDDRHYSKWLFPNFDIISNSIEECYAALYGGKALAISNSSFSYFPIKTRLDKPFVIAPLYCARYDNEYERWASPANLYKDWKYLNKKKEIFNFQDLETRMIENEIFFKENFKIGIISVNKVIKNKYFFIPKLIRVIIKKILNKISPKRF